MDNKIYQVIKQPAALNAAVVVFSIVGNEMYFLPHFLQHYRKLKVEAFYFLVDKSDDGTLEYLMAQDDCAVITSKVKFNDQVKVKTKRQTIQGRFASMCKQIIPKDLLLNRWVLTVDADEFLILPEQDLSLIEFTEHLNKSGLDVCRAPMVDFFPKKLECLDDVEALQKTPFEN